MMPGAPPSPIVLTEFKHGRIPLDFRGSYLLRMAALIQPIQKVGLQQ